MPTRGIDGQNCQIALKRVREESFAVYGVRKVWLQMNREAMSESTLLSAASGTAMKMRWPRR